jgi:hypothetical protein
MRKEVGPGAGASGPTDDDRIYGSVRIRIAVAGCKAEGAGAGESFPFLRPLGTYWSYWPLRDGPNPKTEVDVLLATHGWWPWLLTLFILILIACGVIAYFVKRRRAAA